jgi:hypothetical protein
VARKQKARENKNNALTRLCAETILVCVISRGRRRNSDCALEAYPPSLEDKMSMDNIRVGIRVRPINVPVPPFPQLFDKNVASFDCD